MLKQKLENINMTTHTMYIEYYQKCQTKSKYDYNFVSNNWERYDAQIMLYLLYPEE